MPCCLPLLPPAEPHRILPIFSCGEKPIIVATSFDSVVKPNRYKSAGRSGGYSEACAVLGRFFGRAHTKLWEMKASGELYVAQSLQAEVGADEVSIEVAGECHPLLSCARETSLQSGISDECGVTGGVCSHGQPLLGMFLAMPAPERFLYYDLALQELLLEARVNVMYLDTGCSYSRHRQLHLPLAAAPSHIRVPWWHARGHGASCYLCNSGLYLPGTLCSAAKWVLAYHVLHLAGQVWQLVWY
jgi:hypothetical protein